MNYLREKDDRCIELCKLQSRLFARASKENIPSAFFVKVFANSNYCRVLDNLSYFDLLVSEQEIFEGIKSEVKMNRGTIVPDYIMEWVGYILREWSYLFNQRTKVILKKVPFSYIASVYNPYHSLDIKKAIQLIAESKNIDLNERVDERVMMVLKTVI